MRAPEAPLDPRDLVTLTAVARAHAPEGAPLGSLTTRRVVIDADAGAALVDAAREASTGGPVVLVQDGREMMRGGRSLKPALEEMLRAADLPVRRVVLAEDDGGALHATMEAAAALADRLDELNAACVVSVGSGSVTDVAKHARVLAEARGGNPILQVCYPTAASVTAYSSALAVLTVDGVKRTQGSRAPEFIVCDLTTLAEAPAVLTRAGFGDVLARSVSYADWYLAAQLGLDDGYNEVPDRLLRMTERELLARAGEIATAEAGAVRLLLDALLLSGFAMSLVSQTAPLSGWEHTISHMLDLISFVTGEPHALHGAQVGVGTLVAARAYDVVDELPIKRILKLPRESERAALCAAALEPFDVAAGLAREFAQEVEVKYAAWEAQAAARRAFVADWDTHQHALRALARRAEEIVAALEQAGAARTFGALEPAVERDVGRHAVRFAHLVRKRFTLGDLLSVCGMLEEDTAGRWMVD